MEIDLDALLVGVEKSRRASRARNTVRAYAGRQKAYAAFLAAIGESVESVGPEHVCAFLQWLAESGKKANTINNYFAALRALYKRGMGLRDVTHDEAVLQVREGILRTIGMKVAQAEPLRVGDLRKVGRVCRRGGVAGVRDWAIVLIAWSTGRRCDEVLQLDVQDVVVEERQLRVWVGRSKTDQRGQGLGLVIGAGRHKGTCPVLAYRAWQEVAGLEDGPAFCHARHGVLYPGKRLGNRGFFARLEKHFREAGLKGDYSTHSLRAGFVTEAFARGLDRSDIKARTGHKDDGQLGRYNRPSDDDARGVSRLMGL